MELAAIERGAGPVVTLIHGGVFHSGPAWARTIGPLVEAGYRVIAVDRRGHGRSPAGPTAGPTAVPADAQPAEPGPVPVAAQAEDVAATLRQRDVAPSHVVGVSYGALVALELAMRHPELVGSLTLVEPALFAWLADDPDFSPWITRLREWEAVAAQGAPHQEWLSPWLGLIDPELARDLVPGSPGWPLAERAIGRLHREESAASYRPEAAALARLAVPTLVVNGADTEPALHAVADRLSASIPGAEQLDIPGAAHQVHAQEWAVFNEVLAIFLARHPLAGTPGRNPG